MPKTVADLRRSYRRYGIRCSTNVSGRATGTHRRTESRQRRPFSVFFVHLSMKGTGNALHVTHGKTVTATPLIDRMLPGGIRRRELHAARPCHRPAHAPPRRLCGRRTRRTGRQGRLDRLDGTLRHRTRPPGHLPAGGLLHRLSQHAHARIRRLGRHALHRDRACGGRRAARRRDRHPHAVPPHGREPRRVAGDRPARDRKEPGRQPRRFSHRALLSRRIVLARRLPQRPDRTRRRPVGERLLHGRHRDSQHQPLRHAGRFGRPREHRQLRSGARDQFLHRRLPRRPGRSAQFGAGFPPARRRPRKTLLQGDARRIGSVAERQRPPLGADDLPLLRTPVLPATAVQDAGTSFPAQLHRCAGQDQEQTVGPRRADRAGTYRHRQHASEHRRKGRGG